jgi:excisionase family DNA binding protein
MLEWCFGEPMKRYTVKEASQYLGVSQGLIYGLCSRRRLRHERHGLRRGRILIPEDALDEYRRSATVAVEQNGPASMPAGIRVRLKRWRKKARSRRPEVSAAVHEARLDASGNDAASITERVTATRVYEV